MICYLAFTDRGFRLAQKLAAALGGRAARSGRPLSGAAWTRDHFHRADALVYIGACGIAVRLIAPHLHSKAKDPAVAVLDEEGKHVISLVSGHLGGANDLCRRIAAVTGGDPVITTATDVSGTFSVDAWARQHDVYIPDPSRILPFARKLLQGKDAKIRSRFPFQGEEPDHIDLEITGASEEDTASPDAWLDYEDHPDTLLLVPRILYLGIGCRRGISEARIEEQFQAFLKETGLREEAFAGAGSIDRKQDEPGLLKFCEDHRLPCLFFTPQQLEQVSGSRSSSAFVQEVTGVDNVCERAALRAASVFSREDRQKHEDRRSTAAEELAAKRRRENGHESEWNDAAEAAQIRSAEILSVQLTAKKYAGGGVTLAAAAAPFLPDWRDHV